MKLAQRVTQITPSATMAVKRAADELKRQGISVIDLGPGEPRFPHARAHQARRRRGPRPEFHKIHG
jgi:aspartate/methionine/tyrosine aminotransferase